MQYKILIPARGGSKRIPRKNIIDLNGKPLISYAIEQALELTEDVYVSTDDNEIAKVSEKYGARVITRPPEISGDLAKTEEVIHHFLNNEETEVLVLLQATCPLIKSDYILRGLKLLHQFDSVVSVSKEVGFYWSKEGAPINFTPGKKPRTQDATPWYKENGSFYITRKEFFKKTGLLVGGKVGLIEMPQTQSIDIDTHEELFLAELIIQNHTFRNKKND